MAEPTQYKFTFQELAAALMKAQDIHEGMWQLAFEFSMTAGNLGLGPEPTDAKPGTIIQIGSAMLVKLPQGVSPDVPLVFDAAVLNRSERKKRRARAA